MMDFPALKEIKLEYFAWEMVLLLLPKEAHETSRLAGLPQQIQPSLHQLQIEFTFYMDLSLHH